MSVILITGGAGFIGSNLAHTLLSNGNKVVVIDNFNNYYDSQIKKDNIADLYCHADFQLYNADLTDKRVLENLFQNYNFDCVVHLAGSAGVRPSIDSPLDYVNNNIYNTVSLLECLKKSKSKKIVFASSSSVYGNLNEKFFSEKNEVKYPISPYAASKLSCEHFIYTYAHLYGIKACCLRFFTVYGPKQRPDLAIHKFIEKINKSEPIQLYGDGTSSRDYTYIDDIISGILAAVKYDQSLYEIINIGSGRPITLLEMINTIENALHKKAVIQFVEKQMGDVERTCADISKAETLLGYQPKTSFQQGIENYVAWLKDTNRL